MTCNVSFYSKPLNYAIALNELGADVVHSYVGQEPSGRKFNDFDLMYNSKYLIVHKNGIAQPPPKEGAWMESNPDLDRLLSNGGGYAIQITVHLLPVSNLKAIQNILCSIS